MRTLLYILLGYFFGSLLFAKYFGFLFCKTDITAASTDNNPGTFNAFKYGGGFCGVLTLCCDLLKGAVPIIFYLSASNFGYDFGLAFVLAAPVIGHIFPIFHNFKGGKGIAVSFGCLLGLFPQIEPVIILACSFLFFSLILKISPHYYRTLLTYILSLIGMLLIVPSVPICLGFIIISCTIIFRLLHSTEKRGKFEVKLLWMH